MSPQSSHLQQKDSKAVVASPLQQQANDSSSSPTTTTEPSTKFPLHFTVTCATLVFLIIALAISLSLLFDGSFNTVIKSVNLLADETVQDVAQKVERVFQRSTSSMAGAVNSTKIFGNPYQYNETTQPEQYNRVHDTYVSHLYRYGSTLQHGAAISVRFSQNSAVAFTSSSASGFVKQQICSTPYKKFSDVPPNVALDSLTCNVQAYNRSSLQILSGSNPLTQAQYRLSTRTSWLGLLWNFSQYTILSSKSTNKRIFAFWYPQITFGQIPPANDGLTDREFFMYQYIQMSFDPSTGVPIANGIGVFLTSRFYAILSAALPDHKGEEEFQAFLVDSNGHVLAASHITRPFATIYLNTTGGKVWKGCTAFGGYVMGCFYNTSDYAPYRLLHLALTSPIHKNWTQQHYLSPSFSSSESNNNNLIFSNVVGEADDLEEQVVVFKKQVNSEFSGLSVFVYVMIPMKSYLSPVYSARRTTIALVVVFCLIGGVITYLILRRSTSSVQDLAEKMKDPFRAKLTSNRHRTLVKQEKEQVAKQRVEAKHQKSVLEEEEPKKQEQEEEKDSKKKKEEEETDSVSWYQRLVEWKPAEIVILEEEFLAFREVIDNLRGFMKYDFAGAANASVRKNSRDTSSPATSNSSPTSSSTSTKPNSQNDVPPKVIVATQTSSSNSCSVEKHENTSSGDNNNNNKVEMKNNDDDVVAPLNQTENSNGRSSPNVQQQSADEKHNNENPKGILKYSSSSPKPAELSGESQEKKKGISFHPDVPIQSVPAKPVMTKRKHFSSSSSSSNKAALYESSMCFVAAVQVPLFTQPDNFFYLDHGDEAKQIFLDLSKFIVEKLNLIALSNGATLLDFCGDFFLIAIQIRKRVLKTKVPTRFSLDLMRVANEIQEEISSKIVKKYSSAETNSQTRSLVKLENFLPWNDTSPLLSTSFENKQHQSSSTTTTTQAVNKTFPSHFVPDVLSPLLSTNFENKQHQTLSAASTATTSPTQQSSCYHVKTSPKKKTIEPILLDNEICRSISIHDAVSALARTKPEKRATTEKDIAAISVAMHRECVLYAGLSCGWTRLFQWPSFNNNSDNNNNNNNNNTLISRTSSTSETTNIKQQQKQPSTLSRSVTIFGEVISEAFTVANTMKKAELRQELNPCLYHAIGFTDRCSEMFEIIFARHLKVELPFAESSNGGVARLISVSRVKKEKKREADEEEIAQDERKRELRASREQQQQQQQQPALEQLLQQFKQLQQQRERTLSEQQQQETSSPSSNFDLSHKNEQQQRQQEKTSSQSKS